MEDWLHPESKSDLVHSCSFYIVLPVVVCSKGMPQLRCGEVSGEAVTLQDMIQDVIKSICFKLSEKQWIHSSKSSQLRWFVVQWTWIMLDPLLWGSSRNGVWRTPPATWNITRSARGERFFWLMETPAMIRPQLPDSMIALAEFYILYRCHETTQVF